MNKYLWLIVIAIVLVGGGIGFRFLGKSGTSCPATGITREATVTAVKDRWLFEPEAIEVDCGDAVKLTVVNEDSYDHGIAIDQFGVSQRMPANGTITVEFFASKPGEWPFFCSVPCGECQETACEVDGKRRTHFDMVGKIRVRGVISGTP